MAVALEIRGYNPQSLKRNDRLPDTAACSMGLFGNTDAPCWLILSRYTRFFVPKLLPILRHPVDHAMRYVAKRPGLKQSLRPWIVRLPFIYRWVVERRKRQIRADFLKAWRTQGQHVGSHQSVRGCYLSVTPAKSVDDVLQAIRKELKDSRDHSNAG